MCVCVSPLLYNFTAINIVLRCFLAVSHVLVFYSAVKMLPLGSTCRSA